MSLLKGNKLITPTIIIKDNNGTKFNVPINAFLGYVNENGYVCNYTGLIDINYSNVTNFEENYFYNRFNGNTLINSVTFSDNTDNLGNMSYAFYKCNKLSGIFFNNGHISNLFHTFDGCINLVNIPSIPDSVTNMLYTFSNCTNLVNAPIIPSSVVNLSYAFTGCTNLVNIPIIPDSVTSMSKTFYNCIKLSNMSEISNNVINLSNTFDSCINLSGDIFIYSKDITNAVGCFANTVLNKDVFIYFQYDNGKNTKTYDSFTNAGYSIYQRVDGVLLIDANTALTDWTYTNESNGIRTLCSYIGTDSNVLIPLYKTQINEYSQNALLFSNNTNITSVDIGYVNIINDNISHMFYGCSNLSNVIHIPDTISNMSYTYDGCNNISGDIFYKSDNIINVESIYGNTSSIKNIYINFTYINDVNTQTYNSFTSAGYSDNVVKDGVTLIDYQDYILNQEWLYDTLGNGVRLLYNYIGDNNNISVPFKNTIIDESRLKFSNNQKITSIDMSYVPLNTGNMSNMFNNCQNLMKVNNFNESIINFSNAFNNCTRLTDVPTLPSNLVHAGHSFRNCKSLTSINLCNIETINGSGVFSFLCSDASNLREANVCNIKYISGYQAFKDSFSRTSLEYLNLCNLYEVHGDNSMRSICYDTKTLTNVNFSSLSIIDGTSCLWFAFFNCSNLKDIYFPSLTTTSFGTNKTQFTNMFSLTVNCNIHFPNNLGSTVSTLTGYPRFNGGSKTTCLFDLPSTN